MTDPASLLELSLVSEQLKSSVTSMYGDVLADMFSKVVGVIQHTQQEMTSLDLLQRVELG